MSKYIVKLIIYLAFLLEDSKSYLNLKRFFYRLMSDEKYRPKLYFDIVMIFLVIASVTLLLYGVKNELTPLFITFEYFVVGVFILEYLIRFWVYSDSRKIVIEEIERVNSLSLEPKLFRILKLIFKDKFRYISSPIAIIDLLAILPTFRGLRILRLFLLFRLFKLFRYSRSIGEFLKVLLQKKFEIFTLSILVGFVVLTSSVGIYLFESDLKESQIDTFFDAIYWALVTISTVGYGDISPVTVEGRAIAMVLILFGIALISFSTSIVTSAFSEKLEELKLNRVKAEIEKMRDFIVICGFGRAGQIMAKKLTESNDKFVVVDIDREKIELAKSRGFLAVESDAKKSLTLSELGVGSGASKILSLTNDDRVNIYITLSARALDRDIYIISRVSKREREKKFFLAGANRVIYPFELSALIATEYVGQPVAFEAIYGLVNRVKGFTLEDIEILEGSFLDGERVENIDFEKFKVILFGVIRKNILNLEFENYFDLRENYFIFNPEGSLTLKSKDSLALFGDRVSIFHLRAKIEESAIGNVR